MSVTVKDTDTNQMKSIRNDLTIDCANGCRLTLKRDEGRKYPKTSRRCVPAAPVKAAVPGHPTPLTKSLNPMGSLLLPSRKEVSWVLPKPS